MHKAVEICANHDTKNHMKPWTAEQDKIILVNRKNGLSFEEIAKLLFRTVGGIESRMYTLAVKLVDTGSQQADVMLSYNLDANKYAKYSNKATAKKLTKAADPPQDNMMELLRILRSIDNSLALIASRIDPQL